MRSTGWQGDLLRRDSIDGAMKDCRYVFHVAGDYRFWARDPREIFANNVQGTINLLEAAKRREVEKIVCTSTTGILNQERRSGWQRKSVSLRPLNSKDPIKVPSFGVTRSEKEGGRGWPIVTILPMAPIGLLDRETDANWNDRGRI